MRPGRFTYRQMNERANRLANWLRDAAGVQRATGSASLARNGVEFLDAFFACGKLGAISGLLQLAAALARAARASSKITTPKALIYLR